MAKFLEDDQGNLSKKLHGKISFNIEQISEISSLILEIISSMPHKPIIEFYTKSESVVKVNSDDSVNVAVTEMTKGGFTQLPVINKKTGKCLGIVTDFTLLKRMLTPNAKSEEKWLNKFKKMSIIDADIIDESPTYPMSTSIAEIAQALLFHYAILIIDEKGEYGIVTRADFIKILS